MTLELLPNEMLHEIFEFLDVVELVCAFHDLNSRFNALLFTQFPAWRLNFYSMLKYQSDFLVQRHLPSIANHLISLRLSDNNDESSPQTGFFFSSDLQLSQFTYLRSLSLCYIDDEEILRKIIVKCHQLRQLTHLKVVKCYSDYMSSVDFSNIIWDLPKLTHCRLNMQGDFCIPTVISTSLEYLSISCQYWWLNQIGGVFQQTPYLRHLCVPLNRSNQFSMVILPSFQSLTTLKLSNVRSSEVMKTMLLAVPNLIHLKVDAHYINYDGYLWEELIDDHLPQLDVFHLRMRIQFFGEESGEKHVDELVNSFCTRFWLEKHQWFLHCRHTLKDNCRFILIYTVPYAFHDLDLDILTMPYKSTCLQDTNNHLYDRVNNLFYNSSRYEDRLFVQFFNIRNLFIHLPISKHFQDIVPSLHQLKSLTVLSAKEDAHFHLQSLLDRTPHLNSLTIRSWSHSQVPAIENTNTSLRRLDIRPYRGWSGSSFLSSEECKTFSHSPLTMHCEELLINVKNHESILDLINNMHHLRILHVQCQLDNVLIKWLQRQFPTASIISRVKQNNDGVQLWIYLKYHIVTAIHMY